MRNVGCNATHQPSRIPRPQASGAAGSRQPGEPGGPRPERQAARWLQMVDRIFARQCRCSNPCNPRIKLHEPRAHKRVPLPGSPPPEPAGRTKPGVARARMLRMAKLACKKILKISPCFHRTIRKPMQNSPN